MMKFMKCEMCGNIITHLKDSGVIPQCCGSPMQQLVPGIIEGAGEKHIPVIKIVTGTIDSRRARTIVVEVGEYLHPMSPDHYVQWIILETNKGFRVHYLEPTDQPRAEFLLSPDEDGIAAYEYCNIHGLWRTEM